MSERRITQLYSFSIPNDVMKHRILLTLGSATQQAKEDSADLKQARGVPS